VIEIEGEPDGRDEWVLPDCPNGSRRRLPAQRPQTRRSARDQVARGTQLDRSVDRLEPAAEDVIRHPAEGVALDAGLDGAARDQRRGVTAQLARGPEDVDRSLDVVDVDDLTGILAEVALGRVNRRPPDADPVVLWREPVPADEAALATRLEVPLVGQTADAFAGFDQSVNAQLLEPEVVPPLGLGVPTVPVEELGEEPAVALVLGSLYLGLSTGLGPAKTIETVATGFGDIMMEVGLLIAFGLYATNLGRRVRIRAVA